MAGKTFKYTYKDKEYSLTEKEKLFCDHYLQEGANGVSAVYDAGYDVKNARVAAAIASENLTKPNIYTYISMNYEEHGFNDEDVMKQHLFLINQDADLKVKNSAIDMYYKKKGVYAPEKHEHAITGVEIVSFKKDDKD